MPNWCECELKVSGDYLELERFKNLAKSEDEKTKYFSLSKFLPTPKSLLEAEAGYMEIAYTILYGEEKVFQSEARRQGFENPTREEALSGIIKQRYLNPNEDFAAKLKLFKEAAERYRYNLETYGKLNWYDWNIENWGTKWDVMDCEYNEGKVNAKGKACGVYSFASAWSPPSKGVQSISEMFPKLLFDLRFWESGCGFKGRFVCKRGNVLHDITKDYKGCRGG